MHPYLNALVHPELIEDPTKDRDGITPVFVPCIEVLPEPDTSPIVEPQLTASVPCTEVGDLTEVEGEGLFPNYEGVLWWLNPLGNDQWLVVRGWRSWPTHFRSPVHYRS